MDIHELKSIVQNDELRQLVDVVWNEVGVDFVEAQGRLPAEYAMERKELSFHEHVKLLGYFCFLFDGMPGDIIEIGVWKGRSAAFMSRMCKKARRIFGVDPFELPRQFSEMEFYHREIFPEVHLIRGHSEFAIGHICASNPRTLILHIDGGHAGSNVLLDFLLYSRTVVRGGVIIFDDYGDHLHSPEVGPAVDLLRAGGYFREYNVIGVVPGFENSYLIQKS